MKKAGNFEGLMDEVYKTLYEKKNTKESKLTEFTKEVLLKIKKNGNLLRVLNDSSHIPDNGVL